MSMQKLEQILCTTSVFKLDNSHLVHYVCFILFIFNGFVKKKKAEMRI